MSTTRDLKTAADFARDKGTGKTTLMQISGKKKGVEVTKHPLLWTIPNLWKKHIKKPKH